MPLWIVAHSDALCNFLLPLLAELTGPQQRHALNVVAALLVCTRLKHRTLAALTRVLRVPHADQFACADFFRCSAWSAAQVQQALMRFLLQTVVRIQQVTGWRLLFLSVDDALAPKDVATTALEAVTFHHDHVEQRRQKKHYTNASRYVTVHLQLGAVQLALAWRLYLSRKQVQRLNRARRETGQPVLRYHSLVELVETMLGEIAPQLPTACRVYVLFDSWYEADISNASFTTTAGIGSVPPNPIELFATARSVNGGPILASNASRPSSCVRPRAPAHTPRAAWSVGCAATPNRW